MHRSFWKAGFNWIPVPRERARPVSRFIWKCAGTGDCPGGGNLGLRREKSSTSMADHEAQCRTWPWALKASSGGGDLRGLWLGAEHLREPPLTAFSSHVRIPRRSGRARKDFTSLAAWSVQFPMRCQQPPFQGQNIYPKCNSFSTSVRTGMITYVNTVAETK